MQPQSARRYPPRRTNRKRDSDGEPACTWDERRILGAKRALKPRQVWAIRFWLDHIDGSAIGRSSPSPSTASCADGTWSRSASATSHGAGAFRDRAIVVQQKTRRRVQFELMEAARKTMRAWLERRGGTLNNHLFPSRNAKIESTVRYLGVDLRAVRRQQRRNRQRHRLRTGRSRRYRRRSRPAGGRAGRTGRRAMKRRQRERQAGRAGSPQL